MSGPAIRRQVFVSFFEIYGGRCQDLLNRRHRLVVREDGKGEVHIAGLEEVSVSSEEDLHALIEQGNRIRTTQKTEANDTSSRSHAICQIALRRQVISGLCRRHFPEASLLPVMSDTPTFPHSLPHSA